MECLDQSSGASQLQLSEATSHEQSPQVELGCAVASAGEVEGRHDIADRQGGCGPILGAWTYVRIGLHFLR